MTEWRALLAIEVKSQANYSTRMLSGLRAIGELPRLVRRILVYLGSQKLKTEDGIEVWPLQALFTAVASDRLWP